MQLLEVSGAVRPIYGSLGVKRLSSPCCVPQVAAHDSKSWKSVAPPIEYDKPEL